ncbi:hypothetical protein MGYG_02038 [Nannizzia gypsea CBS 118893]|uniref:Major facilitator superfamily (MFS) profile domain-containing protein n=1 Tax=Arthroderma gypseum (strain ATCC MYA-4604 / CBS 118893) TaxID=535722 RepID=E4UPD7_ARTGP|nr:hypothetical protein MGYG_02038 [Nannizzia gypsea CBS 118893]EFQ99026.1 hypothetical protein MGYG_02038 [Nannizzia gypsea CBS 118893]
MAAIGDHFAAVRGAFNRRLLLSCALIAFSQVNFGFDQVAFSTTQAMDAFERRFGVQNQKTKKFALAPAYLSMLNALPYLGFLCGLFVGSSVSARWGRRMVMFTMSIHAMIMVPITVTSSSREQMLAARVLNYIYLGMELAVVPVFQAEIVPAQVRGAVVATYQLCIYVGGLIMSLICRATIRLDGNAQWQIPLALFGFVPLVVSLLIWFIPESPRWLLVKGRHEDSLKALRTLRDGRFTEDQIMAEYTGLRTRLGLESTQQKGSYADCFRGTDLRRTIIAIGVNVFLQATGQVFTARYSAVYIKSLGTVDPFTITIVNQLVNLLGVTISMLLVDHLGRRPLLYASSILQTIAWFAMAGLGTPRVLTQGMRSAIVALIAFFNISFCIGWAPLSHTIAAEVPSSRLRDMTFRTANAVNLIMQLVITLVIPYLIDDRYAGLGTKIGYLFAPLSILSLIFAYFYVPETTGKALEELDALFADRVPTRQFRTAAVGNQAKDAEVEAATKKKTAVADLVS